MVSAQSQAQKPSCPVCQRTDKVVNLQTAYREGMNRFAPPPMPTKTVSMQAYILTGMGIIALCVFFIIIFVGSESFGQDFSWEEFLLVAVTLICIVSALGLSYYAFNKVMKADQEIELQYPAWDKAMEQWGHLYYCSRDNVVFDPQTNKTVSDATLTSMLSLAQSTQPDTSLAHHQ